MNLRAKLLLVAIVPLMVSLGLTAFVLRQQQIELAQRQQAFVRASYTEASESELRHYVALALSTVSPLYNTGRDDDEIKRLAIQQLAQLDYGPDGYFFLYAFDGTNLMHPRQPELVGRQLMGLRDPNGLPAIRMMIDKARAGGGFLNYAWNKPSTREVAPKLAYVTGLSRWNWMIGTGIYTDDLDLVILQLDRQLQTSLATTLRWIALTAFASVAVVLAGVMGLGINELRAADAKLTLLARKLVRSQEDERAWLSRELHDGTSQTLVSAKLLTESALERMPEQGEKTRTTLLRALDRINTSLSDIRGMSHRLRPTELDTLGLSTALRQLGEEMCSATGTAFELAAREDVAVLPNEIKTTLFRVSQEALTNVHKHADATRVRMVLESDQEGVRLSVEDNGRGFDSNAVADNPRRGIGLHNMRERLVAIGGSFVVSSRRQGTLLVAMVPAAAIRRFARVT